MTLLLPVSLKHVDHCVGMLIHELCCLVGELGIDGIFLLFVHFDLDLVVLVTLVLGHILVLAERIYKRCGLAIHIVVVTVRAKSALDRFEK